LHLLQRRANPKIILEGRAGSHPSINGHFEREKRRPSLTNARIDYFSSKFKRGEDI